MSAHQIFIATLLAIALLAPVRAHELQGIDHAHLPNGMVQIIEPIPGGADKPPEPDAKTEAPAPSRPEGMTSLLIQAVLIGSALALMGVVALRSGRRPTAPPDPDSGKPRPASSIPDMLQ